MRICWICRWNFAFKIPSNCRKENCKIFTKCLYTWLTVCTWSLYRLTACLTHAAENPMTGRSVCVCVSCLCLLTAITRTPILWCLDLKLIGLGYVCLWQFKRFSSVKTEYRLICSGCRPTQGGQGYTGSVSQTVGGRQCQRWSSNSPHTPWSGYTDSGFPDGSRAAADNYCRNPDASYQGGVWCYTVDPSKRWELCDVPMCPATTASGIFANFAAAMTCSVMPM